MRTKQKLSVQKAARKSAVQIKKNAQLIAPKSAAKKKKQKLSNPSVFIQNPTRRCGGFSIDTPSGVVMALDGFFVTPYWMD